MTGGSSTADWARTILEGAEAGGLTRTPRVRHGGSHPAGTSDGRPVVVFSANDYLGLAVHPRVRRAAAEASRSDGVGATGSRHLSGGHAAIAALESELAAFEEVAGVILAPTGYLANLAVLQALGGPDAVILSDQRNHASIIDGGRLSRARVEIYPHGDLEALGRALRTVRGRPIIVSDTVFSMDGTVADVAGLDELARRHSAWLVLDEAHATGVLGPGGRGAVAEAGLDSHADHLVRIVTLSKALGASGGAIAGSLSIRQLAMQRGRALMFSTALPHPTVAAARAALAILREDQALPQRARAAASRLRSHLAGLEPMGRDDVPIVPLIIGSPGRAVELEAALAESGWLVQAERPPAVAPNTSRLRLAVSTNHTDSDLKAVASAIREVLTSS